MRSKWLNGSLKQQDEQQQDLSEKSLKCKEINSTKLYLKIPVGKRTEIARYEKFKQ